MLLSVTAKDCSLALSVLFCGSAYIGAVLAVTGNDIPVNKAKRGLHSELRSVGPTMGILIII